MSEGSSDTPAPVEQKPEAARRRRLIHRLIALPIGLLAVALVMYGLFALLASNVRHVELARGALGESRPAKAPTSAVNILVVGSDQRYGPKGEDEPGERTDTIILVHLSPERNEAAVLSFPRDSLVQLPACRDGSTNRPAHRGMINASLIFGGVGCTWKTIESLTGIRVDHVIRIDFTGFKNMVDAIGGVDYCIPEPIRDTYAPVDLPAGWQTLDGEQALGYVRARHSIGDGSDIGRIQRQQAFLAAILAQATSFGTLANPVRLVGLMNAVTQSVTTDPGVDARVMRGLALTLLSTDNIRFLITPWRYSRAYPGRIEWRQVPARKLFRAIAADKPLAQFGGTVHAEPDPPETSPTDTSPVADAAAKPIETTDVTSAEQIVPAKPDPCTLASN